MSESIPESIPTSSFRRPAKRARTTEPGSQQSSSIDALFANPDRALEVNIGPKSKTLAAPPEIVTNVQGSSAGAGSGEFHVYKASRRREYERLRAMDEEVEKEEADREWEERKEEARRKEEAKLSKNRAKREKQKARLAKGKDTTMSDDGSEASKTNGNQLTKKKKLAPAQVKLPKTKDEGDTETMESATTAEPDGITFLEDG